MVARRFFVQCGDERFPIDYDTGDGLEVLKFQIFSITSIPPDDQKIVVEEDAAIELSDSSDLATISDNLRLLSLQAEVTTTKQDVSDEELARILQAEEEALYMQQFHATGERREFEDRVRSYIPQVLMYEDPMRQDEARKTTPVDEIEEKALVSLWKEGIFCPSKDQRDHAFLVQLLYWFKRSFSWVNAPVCDTCGSETSSNGMGVPLPSEACYGASRVEIYSCSRCSRITRFPRYNDPLKLLQTRRGRCGEWANCFTLYCRAFGYDSRLILDFTDHVWTECFSTLHGRWLHLDPCEGIHDNPLLYEKGWNKKLNYVIAISKDGAHDVTKRYTRKWNEVLSRRHVIEATTSAALYDIRSEYRRGYSQEAICILETRDKLEESELNSCSSYHDSNSSVSLPGRQSGSWAWRSSRTELGTRNFLSTASCPLRLCIDDHVSKLYNALTHLLSDFLSNGFDTSEVLLYLEDLRKLLLDLKSSSFKVRKAVVGLTSNGSRLFKETFTSEDQFLDAIALKKDDQETKCCISLAGDPVKTAVALPVAVDALDEVLENLKTDFQFGQKFVAAFSRSNRISSGTVLASGEELPLGISTSAFDGNRSCKWEEPNGANGCWLIYKAADGKKYDLLAYELMSANDAPERDPMDWIIEGSEDEGSNWYTLDQQRLQQFEKRFQRKRYEVALRHSSNAFRFRFTAVRDPGQPRFQIGSIDLYAMDN